MIRTFLNTNTTTNTEFFRNETNLRSRLYLHAKLTNLHKRTILSTFQITSGWFTLEHKKLIISFTFSPSTIAIRVLASDIAWRESHFSESLLVDETPSETPFRALLDWMNEYLWVISKEEIGIVQSNQLGEKITRSVTNPL